MGRGGHRGQPLRPVERGDPGGRLSLPAAYAGLAAFAWLALFQLLLAAGLPLGRLAWGGRARVLPGRLRLASLGAAAIAVAGVLVMAQTTGLGPVLVPEAALRWVLGVLAGVFALSLVANLAGARGAERLHGVPMAAVLCLSCGWLALAPEAG